MTAIREPDQRTASPPEAGGGGLGNASVSESLTVVGTGVLPALVRGLFSPRPKAMKLLTDRNADERTVTELGKLRRKYGGDGVKLLGGRLVVLWGEPAIRQVLDESADAYAGNAGAKAKGMAHFQPDALTMSYGEEWRERRRFNESVLAARERVHPLAEKFVAIVADEVGRLGLVDRLAWPEWERLFDHITLRVIFGDEAREDQELTARLERLMGEGNRLVGLSPNDDYYELYGTLERYLQDPAPDSLIGQIAEAPHSDTTRVLQQIPHWMFATRDTLAANTFRAMAVIAADDAVTRRVQEELDGDELTYLEGCFQEAMRLWPTTPLLARETKREVTLSGETIDEGTQILILNVFNHRDADHVEDANRLVPERWKDDEPDYRFNHLSNGTQDCPGGPLVLLLGTAALAEVLKRYQVTLESPRLPAGGDLPYMLNFFETRFSVKPR
ncbi:MAG TPA: cytochrome P450 [Solirubrobacteraceae bacterium]|nr:cytochrome P450 [Solirubrobacteraceae bacterium]